MNPRIADVAKKAGCSPAVVSSVLNNGIGTIRFSKNVAKRVREAAIELGYRSPRGRKLGTKKKIHIAVLAHADNNQLDNMYSGVFMGVFSTLLNDIGYELCLLSLDSTNLQETLYDLCEGDGSLSAFIVLNHLPAPSVVQYIKHTELPCIYVNVGEVENSNCVYMDDAKGCRQIVKFLRACEKKRILYVTRNPSEHVCVGIRQKTVVEECESAGIEISEIVNFNELSLDFIKKRIADGIDAIVSMSGRCAKLIVLMLARIRGDELENLMVLAADGFWDEDEKDVLDITHLEISFSQMAAVTAKNLGDMLENRISSFENIAIPEYLVVGSPSIYN